MGGAPSGDRHDDATPEQVILDGNELAEGHAFFAIGATDITDDGRWLAYTTDTTGFRQYTLHIKDLETGETLPGEVERVGSVVWAADNRTLFYTVEDEQQKRQFQLWRHTLGTPHSEDVLVYQDDDERFNLGAGRTRDGKFIVMESASHTTTESWVLAADQPEGSFTLISPRQDEHEYSIDHRNGLWFIRTNDRGRNFRLVTAPVATPGREHWTELIPHRDDVMLEDVDLFAGFFVACEREDGLPRLRLWTFSGDGPDAAKTAEIAFPEPAYSAHPHVNRIFETTTFRYAYQSLVTPSSVYEYDVASGASTLLKQLEIPGGFDRTLYASERVHATAPDGVQVPVSLVYRKDTARSPAAIPSTSTATAPTATRCPSASAPTASACSIAASSWPTRTSAAAATSASPGTTPAKCSSSATPSPTSSPPSSTSPPPATATPRASPSKAALPAACSWAPSSTCAPTSSAPSSPTSPSSTS